MAGGAHAVHHVRLISFAGRTKTNASHPILTELTLDSSTSSERATDRRHLRDRRKTKSRLMNSCWGSFNSPSDGRDFQAVMAPGMPIRRHEGMDSGWATTSPRRRPQPSSPATALLDKVNRASDGHGVSTSPRNASPIHGRNGRTGRLSGPGRCRIGARSVGFRSCIGSTIRRWTEP